MPEIGALEARRRLGALLDMVERGEEIVITRRGRRVARLVRETGSIDREQARLAADRIIANREGRSLGGLKIKNLVNEGRP
jgi:antitoxin (DNA-binding transcriptional repressor) of toxin-antitoxin stability system